MTRLQQHTLTYIYENMWCWQCRRIQGTGQTIKKREKSAIQKKKADTKQTHTSWEEATDHEAEVDGGHSEDEQEDKDQRGVTVGQHGSIRAHLQQKNKALQW